MRYFNPEGNSRAAGLIVLASVFIHSFGYSQLSLSGKVFDQNKAPIANATVLLLHQKDSSLKKGATSNLLGEYFFMDLPAGNYLLLYSHTGMADQYSKTFSLVSQSIEMDVVQLLPAGKKLTAVTVTAKRPLFEQKIDRMVVNVQSSITNAGSTVLEVLERSPGVTVNRESGAISMMGRQGIQLMINGKITYMPADAVIQMLAGMGASGVEKIELVTAPPAKYDAGGGAGMINIVLKSNPTEGLNGSYSIGAGTTFGQGELLRGTTNFNYRKKRINLYGNYTFWYNGQTEKVQGWRSVLYQGNQYENIIDNDRFPFLRNHDPRIGLDYQVSKKTVIGGLVAGYDHRMEMTTINRSKNFINTVIDTTVLSNVESLNHWQNLMGNFNVQHQLNKQTQLSWNADYLWYKNFNHNNFANNYSKHEQFLYAEDVVSSKSTSFNIFVTNADFIHKVNEKFSWETGAKSTFSTFDNLVMVQTKQNGLWLSNPEFTGRYKLQENVYAVYLSGDISLTSKTSMKAGLRYEYTNTNLASETGKNLVDRKYGSLFPTLYLSHKLNEKNAVNLQYNRRISRPGFGDLAPFVTFYDPKTFISGNVALQPAISDGISINYTYRKWLLSVNYVYTQNPIYRFGVIDSVTNKLINQPRNLNYSYAFYLSVSLPIQLAKWWSSQMNITNAGWSYTNFDYNKEKIENQRFQYELSLTETFRLPHDFSVEIFGQYLSKRMPGVGIAKPMGRLNISIQKKMPSIAATLTVNASNILDTWYDRVSLNIAEQAIYSNSFRQREYPVVSVSWTQNFGRASVKATRKRGMASDEVRSRVN